MGSRFSKNAFIQELASRPILFDGPMGTEIERTGALPGTLMESFNLSNNALIRSIHEKYVGAGSRVITANTFAANRIVLATYKLEDQINEIVGSAVAAAKNAAGEKLLVAGAISPITSENDGDAHKIEDAYREQVALLSDEGVDLLVLQSFPDAAAMRTAIEAIRIEAATIPLVAQFRILGESGIINISSLTSGVEDAFALGADVVGLNCGLSPSEMYPILAALRKSFPHKPLSAQPSIGPFHQVDGRLLQTSSPDAFATYARRYLKLGIPVIGSCCGTTPAHTRAMSGAIRMSAVQGSPTSWVKPHLRNEGKGAEENGPVTRALVPSAERSRFGSLLGERFVVSVEVNPPSSTKYDRALDAARRLLNGGATVINTTDGARASLRMDNVAFGSIMQRELACEALVHVCGRDRNVLATVSHLMAAHALGIRNLVLITGDPPKLGDFPDATPVYDVDSIGLLELVKNLNSGVDPAGRVMDAPTNFLCGVGVEPAAPDFDREIDRLFRKKEAGADFVMTQPVYDLSTIDRLLDATVSLGLPILLGVIPLASHRNAEFVHANIPGMAIPGDVRERMKKAGDGPAAREEGVAIAVESLLHARNRIAGAYIVPPVGLYSLALSIIAELSKTHELAISSTD